MILKDPQGCQVPIVGSDTIRIYGVNAHFGMSRQIVCDSGFVNFRDSSLSNDLITNYHWTFGDGFSSQSQNPSHWYRNTGLYPIQLVVTTQHQCKDTAESVTPLRIAQTPHPAIQGDTAGCVPALMHFNGLLVNNDTSALQWQWNFGNNISSTLQHPNSVTYTNAGTFDVRLILSNTSGCSDTSLFPVIVHPPHCGCGPNTIICRYQQTRPRPQELWSIHGHPQFLVLQQLFNAYGQTRFNNKIRIEGG
jgi:hypothetical protein